MDFKLYSSREDCINKRNATISSIDNLLNLYESGNEIMICSDGFDIKDDRIAIGIPTPLLIFSNLGVYAISTNYLCHEYKKRKLEKRDFFPGSYFIIDDLNDDESRLIYSIDSQKIQKGLDLNENKIMVLPRATFIQDIPEEIFKLEQMLLLSQKDIIRTSLIQRIFQTGQVFYSPYYTSSTDSGDFFKALYEYIYEN